MSTKPAVAIVPGAFYERWHYRLLHDGLEKAGYKVTTIALPSTGNEKPTKDLYPDLDTASSAIKSYIDQDLNVVVVMHSYGGLVGSCASKGLLPADQPNGKGVVGLVYLCAGVPMEGYSFIQGVGGQHFPWMTLINAEDPSAEAIPNTGIWIWPTGNGTDPGQLFFQDCDAATREEAVKRLGYWSEGCMWTPATFTAWQEIESNYLITLEDVGLPAEQQEMMTQIPGGKWKRVEKIATGHSPFLSKPDETVAFVRQCCGEEV
ncbi:uncharacterized protein LTR77_003997 [Saxophila tyrrhenica]|uniref:AB hydrolase-1 domain-containing protein n=1 Tax=Saxophila tyrrhenica TaxID=1690608 RepID=A0AAV9PF52_9PEZI|nr:hypothetical protein LTR77_003997 [Saxophila tyrrhenica]